MIFLRWSGQRAGPAGWAVGVLVAWLAFGLTPQVLWVSQFKGLLLSLYVLLILWPALLLYHLVNRVGGIQAVAGVLAGAVADRALLWLLLAWAFSALLEGLAGFGLPVAVVAPMLAGLGLDPVLAVAAVAVGHAWSVTFGDMGVIFQTLAAVAQMDAAVLALPAALALGGACLACGLATARLLGALRLWPAVLALGVLMAAVQYGLVALGLSPLAGLGAGLAGVLGGILWGRRSAPVGDAPRPGRPFHLALYTYGSLALLLTVLAWPSPLRSALQGVVWQVPFPEVRSLSGFVTPAGGGQAFRFLLHPGTTILLVALSAGLIYRRRGWAAPGDLWAALLATWHSAAPASLGIIATVGLSLLMDHCGMTQLLAEGLSRTLGAAFPLVSAWVGMLGAFATGSNNNSNVLFAPLQKNIALLLQLSPAILLATQTAGGSLGSMIAPAKIIVGCSTTGIKGREGEVLRHTLPYGLLIGLLLGAITYLCL